MAEKALKGMRILEYCDMISGPYCTKVMADLGAEVIKIESPGIGDGARQRPPFAGDTPHPDKSGLFLYLNSNKLGITLNPLKPGGKKIFEKLIKETDVLIVDRRPGEMERAGLWYDDLKALNPGLIMASLTPFGLNGPYKNFKAYQLNISHISGQGYLLPNPSIDSDRAPVMMGGNNSDYDPGLVSAIAVLAAYFWKGITGRGQFIELSKQEALISMQRVESVTFANDGVEMTRLPAKQGGHQMPGGIMPCKDGYVVVLMPEEHQWKSLMTLMGNPEWSGNDWCKDSFSRSQHAEELNKHIQNWMMEHTQEEIFRKGQALGCPIAPLQSAENVVKSEQLNSRGFFSDIDHPELGTIKYPTMPYRFSKSPWSLERLAPIIGEHNEEILCDRLGCTSEELTKLKEEGVI
jgi:crotonobetainyl-CoA:carnitine CoA-transferase CaiB-like acyl-CoA transferase